MHTGALSQKKLKDQDGMDKDRTDTPLEGNQNDLNDDAAPIQNKTKDKDGENNAKTISPLKEKQSEQVET